MILKEHTSEIDIRSKYSSLTSLVEEESRWHRALMFCVKCTASVCTGIGWEGWPINQLPTSSFKNLEARQRSMNTFVVIVIYDA